MKLTFLIFSLTTFCSFGQVEPWQVETPTPEKPSSAAVITGSGEANYPGGMKALREHIQKYTHSGWEGSVNSKTGYVSFIVETDGRLTNIQVVRGISPELDDLMLRIVEEMPRWIPLSDKNGPIRSRIRLPIIFITN